MDEKDLEAIRNIIREELKPLLEKADLLNKKLTAIEKDMKAIKKDTKTATEDVKLTRKFLDTFAYMLSMADPYGEEFDLDDDDLPFTPPETKKPPIKIK